MMPKLNRFAVGTGIAVAVLGCTLPTAASATGTQAVGGASARAAAAAPPEGCQRKEAYGTSGWWAAIQGCLTNRDGSSIVKVENDCQYKSLLVYSHVMCRIQGHYAVSKDGAVLQEGAIDYVGDPINGGGTIYTYPYTCAGTGTYTLKLTDLQTFEHRPGYFPRGSGPVPDITVEANGC